MFPHQNVPKQIGKEGRNGLLSIISSIWRPGMTDLNYTCISFSYFASRLYWHSSDVCHCKLFWVIIWWEKKALWSLPSVLQAGSQGSSVHSCFPNVLDLSDALLIHHRAASLFVFKHCSGHTAKLLGKFCLFVLPSVTISLNQSKPIKQYSVVELLVIISFVFLPMHKWLETVLKAKRGRTWRVEFLLVWIYDILQQGYKYPLGEMYGKNPDQACQAHLCTS